MKVITKEKTEPLYYTVHETAELFRCSSQTICRRISEGIITTHPDDRGLITRQYVETWEINHNRETFLERKLKERNELLMQENLHLKNIIKSMIKIGLEVEL